VDFSIPKRIFQGLYNGARDVVDGLVYLKPYLGIVEGALPTLPGRVEEVSTLLYLGRVEQAGNQISVKSYQCCIDYNGDRCGF
jgi:hypothetical protein